MSETLGALYHWSPAQRLKSITRSGLLPRSKSAHPIYEDDGTEWVAPYVCLGTDPAGAWSLSAAIFGVDGDTWHLWQVRLAPKDETHVVPFWGDRIQEVRVRNRIPKSRLTYIAERTVSRRAAA